MADEGAWEGPTVEQREAAKRKRERDDRISSLMGEYLLKGYRMLGSTCSTCGTILMRDRQSQDICIGCEEIDKANKPKSEQFPGIAKQKMTQADSAQNPVVAFNDCNSRLEATLESLRQQMDFATQQLQNFSTLSITARCELCQLIERAASAIIAVQRTTTNSSSQY